MKKITVIAILLILSLVLCACGSLIEPIDYSQNGLKITLDTSYSRVDTNGSKNWYTASYQSSVATIYLLREAFSDELPESTSLTEDASRRR